MTTATKFAEQGKQQLKTLKFADAEKLFQSALKADANSIGARIGLARLRVLQGNRNDAEGLVNDALKLAPQNAEALAMQGVLRMQNKIWNEAILYFEKACKADPQLVMAYVNLARSHRKLGNLQDAEKVAQKAIKLNPKNHRAHAELALVLIKTKKVSEGLKEMIEAIRINPHYLQAYLALGRIYQIAGKIDLTIALYKKGFKHNPGSIKLAEELAGVYAFKGDFLKAYKLAVLIAMKRGSYSDWDRVGNCAVAIGQFEKAEKAFKKSLEVKSENWEAHYNLAELYFSAKLHKKAKQEYVRAIELKSKSYKPFNGIGLLTLMAERNPVEAEKYFLRALELAPGRKEPLLNMAIAFADRKAYVEAEKFARATLRVAKPGDGLHEQAQQLISQIENVKG